MFGVNESDQFLTPVVNENSGSDLFKIPEPPSIFGEVGKTLVRGVGGVGTMTGHLLKLAGATDTGESLDVASEKLTEDYAMAPEYQESFVKRGLLGGVEAMLPSVAAGLPGAAIGSMFGPAGTVAGGIIGYALSGGAAMGLAEYQNYKDEHKKEFGTDPDDSVESNAMLSGLAEGGFEMVSNFVGGKLVFNVARKGAAATLKDVLRKPLKEAVTDYLKIVGTETSTEVATAIAQAKARQNTGMETAGMLESGAEAIIPSIVMSSLFMSGGIGLKKLRNTRIETALSDPTVDPKSRERAALDVTTTIQQAYIDPATNETSQLGIDTATAWKQYADNAIATGKKIDLDIMLDPVSLGAEATMVKLSTEPGMDIVTPVTETPEAVAEEEDVEPAVIREQDKYRPPTDEEKREIIRLGAEKRKAELAQEQLVLTEAKPPIAPAAPEIVPPAPTSEAEIEAKPAVLSEEQKKTAAEAQDAIFKFDQGKRGKKEIATKLTEIQTEYPNATSDELVTEFFTRQKAPVEIAKEATPVIEQPAQEIVKVGKTNKVKKANLKLPREGGVEGLEGAIRKMGGIKLEGKYATKMMRQNASAGIVNMKRGVPMDVAASRLQADGWAIEGDEHLRQLLENPKEARKILAPEKAEKILNRQLEVKANEWADEQIRINEEEGIERGAIRPVVESHAETLRGELIQKGYNPEDINTAIEELKAEHIAAEERLAIQEEGQPVTPDKATFLTLDKEQTVTDVVKGKEITLSPDEPFYRIERNDDGTVTLIDGKEITTTVSELNSIEGNFSNEPNPAAGGMTPSMRAKRAAKAMPTEDLFTLDTKLAEQRQELQDNTGDAEAQAKIRDNIKAIKEQIAAKKEETATLEGMGDKENWNLINQEANISPRLSETAPVKTADMFAKTQPTPAVEVISPTVEKVTTDHPIYGQRELDVIEEYGGHYITRTNGGQIAVVSKDGSTVYFPALDDSTMNHKWLEKFNTVEASRDYLNWLNKAQARAKGPIKRTQPEVISQTTEDIFNFNTTNISEYDNLFGKRGDESHNAKGISQKEYYKEYKDLEGKVVMMTPDEYLSKIKFATPYEPQLQKLRDAIAKGNKLPVLHLDYTGKTLSQEGRHRANLAKEIGLKEVPVLIMRKADGILPKDIDAIWNKAQEGKGTPLTTDHLKTIERELPNTTPDKQIDIIQKIDDDTARREKEGEENIKFCKD